MSLLLPKPEVTLFLNTNVLIRDSTDPFAKDVEAKATQLFGLPPKGARLHSQAQLRSAKSHLLDAGALSNLEKLIEKIEEFASVFIVISSTWIKKEVPWENQRLPSCLQKFEHLIIGDTPEAETKDEQIASWLQDNVERHGLDNFAILDSNPASLLHYQSKLVRVDPEKLLSEEDIEKTCWILEAPRLPKPPSRDSDPFKTVGRIGSQLKNSCAIS
jgi:hypothetical protein